MGSTGSGGAAGVDPALGALAARALDFVRADTLIGLGAGRAARAFTVALGERVRAGLRVRAVPASDETAALARVQGIPLVGLEAGDLDVTIDGADEVDPALDLIKGYGGALSRERVLAAAARRQVILVEDDKCVRVLGQRGRLPVEVLPFAQAFCRRRLAALAGGATLRTSGDGVFLTDNGNVVLDLAIGPLDDAAALDRAIRAVPGVVDTGLFLGTASAVLVAAGDTVRERRRPGAA
jgi:ribose 5-phosphate isomerase A